MAPPPSGCCQGAPPGEPGALFRGRESPGVPFIILPSPGGCGYPPCLLVVGDVGAPARNWVLPLSEKGGHG